jgi:uncharacterized phage-associated protein
MSFRFDENKALQLAAIFLNERGGEMKHLKLIKLMYLADREAIKRWGHPITGDRYVSMKYGPVLSNVLELINDEPPESGAGGWSACIVESAPHTVRLQKDPGSAALSPAEVELAHQVFDKYGRMNRWRLVDLTHKFPEYRPPDECRNQWPIRHLDLLKFLGKTQEQAASITRTAKATSDARALLSLKS